MSTPSMDALTWFRKQVEAADADLLREMVTTFAGTLMSAKADALCGAGYGERTPEWVNSRNGYRERTWTRGRARSTWPSPSCARAATSRTGCWSSAADRSGPWWRWWPSAMSEGRRRRPSGVLPSRPIRLRRRDSLAPPRR